MKYLIFPLSLALALLAACSRTVDVVPTDRPCADIESGTKLFEGWVDDPGTIPVYFDYGGTVHQGLSGLEQLSRAVSESRTDRKLKASFRLDGDVEIIVDALLNKEFGETEYTVWIENKGSSPSKEIKDFRSLVIRFEGEDPVIRGCLGDHGHLYEDYDTCLKDTTVTFASYGGRATHGGFPYFDLVHGDGGTMLALGWAGTWKAEFKSDGSETLWTASNCINFDSVILPGEKIRTAMVVMLPYKGRDRNDASNLWREWFIKYNIPKADAKGHDIRPFSTTCFASDTGLPNSDGSISERFYTWKRTLDRLVYEDVIPDFRWFDAGWYFSPDGESPVNQWYETIGAWQLDTLKWPGKSFRESNEACHKAGMKVLVWFESETVTHLEDLVAYHGYDPSWGKLCWKVRYLSNIGVPECREWLLDRITAILKDNEVDLYREDENVDSARGWVLFDEEEEEHLGLPRKGITENKCVQGHYEIWDRILDFCAKNGKCTFIDNCASGGGRNDIESLRRSIPFMRSDNDRTTTALRLSMTWSFCRWVPFHGANTKEAAAQLSPGTVGGSSFYVTRCSWLPVYNMEERWTHDASLDYDRIRATYGEWKKYNHLLLKDFHPLTPWHGPEDDSNWTAFVWHDRETGEAVLQAFRQETCPDPEYVAVLGFLDGDRRYTVTNEDCGETMELTGYELASSGIRTVLPEPKSSAIWHIVPMAGSN